MTDSATEEGTVDTDEGLFEGCGREGPIRAIFLSEFHHIAGPKIVFQYPSDTISKEIFDAVSTYIIPKTHLQRLIMTVNVLGKKIIGFPIQIKNDKYERNAFYFNTCFVCDAWARTVQYESVLTKLAEFFNALEVETEYLSKNTSLGLNAEKELEKVCEAIIQGLNGSLRECSIVFRERLLKLKVVPAVLSDPPEVENHQVPVFIMDVNPIEKWDLTTQQIVPYVDGFNHVVKIGYLADVDTNLVKVCLQNLLYYRVIKFIPIFQYSSTYCTTPEIHSKLIMGSAAFRAECTYIVSRTEHTRPNFADVVRFYCGMKRGVTIKELCCRFRTVSATSTTTNRSLSLDGSKYGSSKYSDHSLSSSTQSRTSSNPTTPIKLNFHQAQASKTSDFKSISSVIDERRLVLFGLVHGIIRRIEKYPILQCTQQRVPYHLLAGYNCDSESKDQWLQYRKKYETLYKMFDGLYTFDQICLAHELSQSQLDDMVERDPDVVMIWK